MKEGKKQLALWLSEACMSRLKALAAEEGTTQADLLERAITQYQQQDTVQALSTVGSIKARLDDHEARLSTLENQLVLSSEQLDKPLKALAKKHDSTFRDQQIVDLHAQGVSGREIAKQLRVSRHTVQGALNRQQAQEHP
jgi:DNA-binding NarL/FixJ family response regulator